MLDTLIPQEDEDATKELAKQFGKRGIALNLGKQCTKVEEGADGLTVHFGEGETVQADLMLVSVGRARSSRASASSRPVCSSTSPGHRNGRPSADLGAAHLRGRRLRRLLAARAHRVPRGEIAAENATGHEAVMGARAVPRPIYTDPEIAGVGLTETEAREQHGDDVAVGRFRGLRMPER